MLVLDDDFDGPGLDRRCWLPHYLPAWSSLADTMADHEVRDSRLILRIGPGQGLWCPDTHPEPLRVSGIMSGNHSGPAGSTVAPQPFLDGQTVREAQTRFEGWLQRAGQVEITCRMTLSPRSMAALWLAGWEEDPLESGELCVVEIFGRSIGDGPSAEVGMGVKQLRDPRLSHDFEAPRLAIDIGLDHTYAVDWDTRRGSVPRRRLRDPALSSATELSDAADGRRVRLPALVERSRRPARPDAGGRPDHVPGVSGPRATLRHPGRPQQRRAILPLGEPRATPPPREPPWN